MIDSQMLLRSVFGCEKAAGLRICTNALLIRKRWVFPTERFFEWEPSDEDICRRIGIGHEVTEPDPCMYSIGDMIIMHPDTLRYLEIYVDEYNKEMNEIKDVPAWPQSSVKGYRGKIV